MDTGRTFLCFQMPQATRLSGLLLLSRF